MNNKQLTIFENLKTDDTIKFIDLFAGLGGIRLGFEQACRENNLKSNCVFTSEIKESAIRAYKNNFDNSKVFGDITKIDTNDIPDFDFLLAGFPCQAFSYAGKGLGFLDTRGTLFFEVERILRDKQPFGFILENVEGLVTHDKEKPTDKIGRTLQTILNSLKELGYYVQWKVIDSQYYGVAQSRKRIYILGTKIQDVDLNIKQEERINFGNIKEHNLHTINSHFTKCLLSHYKPDELYGKSIKDKRGGTENIHSWDIGLKGEISDKQKNLLEKLFRERRKRHWAIEIGIEWMDGMPLTLKQISTFYNDNNLQEMLEDMVNKGYLVKEYPKKLVNKKINNGIAQIREQDETKELGYNIVSGKLSFEFTKILDDYSIAPTLVAMDAQKLGVVDGTGIRHLTIREGLRLFGYPDNYTLEEFNNKKDLAKAFDLLGNTVIVPVIKKLANQILTIYKKRDD